MKFDVNYANKMYFVRTKSRNNMATWQTAVTATFVAVLLMFAGKFANTTYLLESRACKGLGATSCLLNHYV